MRGRSARRERDLPAAAARLTGRLTGRDRWLLRMLLEHRVLTSGQITDLAFGTRRMANVRLNLLHQFGVIDRFRPATMTGSAPQHVVLAPLGAEVVADELGVPVAGLGFEPDHLARLAVSLHLAHDVGANSVFAGLARQARLTRLHEDDGEDGSAGQSETTGAQLRAWWSERRCLHTWDGLVQPDGYGRWREGDTEFGEVDFFLEYDTGSENLQRVTSKLGDYADLAASSGITTPILFWLPTQARERNLCEQLAAWLSARPNVAATLPVATTTGHGDLGSRAPGGPADAVWLPLAAAGTSPASPTWQRRPPRRVRLISLVAPGTGRRSDHSQNRAAGLDQPSVRAPVTRTSRGVRCVPAGEWWHLPAPRPVPSGERWEG